MFKEVLEGENEVKGKEEKTTKNLFLLFRFAFLAFIFVFIINIFSLFLENPPNVKEADLASKFGAWGDFFGGVLNPIFTFLTFMGLLITIALQQRELGLTRNVLKDQKDEFKAQTRTLEKQQEEMREQTFDNKFFQMLNSFNTMISKLTYNKVHGRLIFEELVIELINEVSLQSRMDDGYDYKEEEFDRSVLAYLNFNYKNSTTVQYYFLNLYQLLRYVDDEAPETINKKKYTNIIRAQLSNHELTILLCNSFSITFTEGNKFLLLIEKYGLLEHIQFNTNDVLKNNKLGNIVKLKPYKKFETTLLTRYKYQAFGRKKQTLQYIHSLYQEADMTKEANDLRGFILTL